MNPNNFNYNYNFPMNQMPNFQPKQNINQDERFIGGGFAFPFLLGGVTGAAIAPAFFGGYNNNRPPYYYNNYYYYYPPYYQPYYRYY